MSRTKQLPLYGCGAVLSPRLLSLIAAFARWLCCAVLCCAVLCCAVLCCAVLCCAVLCCAAGKTTLLVALVVYFHRVLSAVDPHNTVRVLVACNTNVAVDGILSALLRRSHDCFVRVGSSQRIAANILRHTLHATGPGGGGKGVEETHQQAIEDLRQLIAARQDGRRQHEQQLQHGAAADCMEADSDELRDMKAALAELKTEKGQARKRRLLAKRVVAVTCAASAFDILNDSEFPIVLLDECSQMIEPASLLPMQRFGCQRLVAVGDPQQLPPNLRDVEAAAASFHSASAGTGDKSITVTSCLTKPLFERLHNAGLPTVLLRHQYRMHPTLAHMPNQLFYHGQLRDGIDEEARPALLRRNDDHSKSLGPLLFVNVGRGQEVRTTEYTDFSAQRAGSGRQAERDWDSSSRSSWRNDSEVRVVVQTVAVLLQRGIPASSIGVITFYKPQSAKLKEEIANLMSTRDAQPTAQQSTHQQQRAQSPHIAATGEMWMDHFDSGALWDGSSTNAPSAGSTRHGRRVRAEGVQVNTVDSFQGGEKDIIILSTVRTSSSDFLDDPKRINVALTRARHHLVIVGHHSTLLHSSLWKPVVTFVSSKCPGCFFPTDAAFIHAIGNMHTVQLALTVSQKDSAGQMQPSEACNAAGRRRGGQRDGKERKTPVDSIRRREAGNCEEQHEQEEEEAAATAAMDPTAVAVVGQADSDKQQAVKPVSSLPTEVMDDEDAPVLLSAGASFPAYSSHPPPVPQKQQQPRTAHSTQAASSAHEQQRERRQRETEEEELDEDGVAAFDRAERDSEEVKEREASGSPTCGASKRARVSDTPTAARQQPHSPTEAAATGPRADRDDHDGCTDEADEQLIVRHRKRARLLSDDDETDSATHQHQQQQLPRPPQPLRTGQQRPSTSSSTRRTTDQHS